MAAPATTSTKIHGKTAENRRRGERATAARQTGRRLKFDLSKDIAGKLN
jgi:hypothetical protein